MLNIKLILFICAIPLLLGGCMTHKKTLMIKDGGSTYFQEDTAYTNYYYQSYKLQTGNILNMVIKSLDPATVEVFNKLNTDRLSSSSSSNSQSSPITGYLIDQNGYVEMPIAGYIHIEGLTLNEAKIKIEKELKKYFQHFTLSIMLGNYQVDVLGYVNTPGRKTIQNTTVTILSVLAEAGDFQEYANRKRVKLIRQEDGKSKIVLLNLQDLDSIEPKYFFLMPRDVVYVEPDKSLAVKRNLTWFTLTLTTITFFIALMNYNR